MSTLLGAPPDGEAFLTAPEVALALGCSIRAALVWLNRGRFPGAFQTTLERRGHWRVPAGVVARVRVELGIDGGGS